MAHVMALSDIGELYSWGANSYGQVGVGTTLNTSMPTLINAVDGRLAMIFYFVMGLLYCDTSY